MNYIKSFLKSRQVKRIVRSFIVFFLLPFIIISFFILNRLFVSFSQQALKEQRTRAENAMSSLQTYKDVFDQVVLQLVGDRQLNRNKLELYSVQSQLQNRLLMMTISNTDLENIWYYVSDTVGFLSGNDSLSVKWMNEYRYTADIETPGTSIYERLMLGEVLSAYNRYNARACILYPVFINNKTGDLPTMIVFEIRMEAINRILEDLCGTFPGRVRLRNADGQILTEVMNQGQGLTFLSDEDGEKPSPNAVYLQYKGGILNRQHIFQTSVTGNMGTIDLVCENNLVNSFQVMQSVALMMMGLLLLGGCACIFLSIHIFKPIHSLRHTLSDIIVMENEGEDIDDYQYIESSIELINSDNLQLRNMLEDHQAKSREFVSSMLFTGRIKSRKEFLSLYSFCNFHPKDDTYWIVVADCAGSPFGFESNIESDTVLVQTVDQRYMLFCMDSIPEYVTDTLYAASGPDQNWGKIPLHCAKAWFAYSMGEKKYTEELGRDAIQNGSESLIHAFETAVSEKHMDILRKIWQDTSAGDMRTQVCCLIALVIQWMESLDQVLLEDASLFHISSSASNKVISDTVSSILSWMESKIHPEESNGSDVLEQIYQYLNQHYDSPDFSIKQMASDFSMSISSLSMFFKSHTGILLSDYITDMKMKKAKQLLEYTNLSIQEVGMAIGYLNVNSFSRRFQQVNNQTPKEYRQQFLSQKKDSMSRRDLEV